MTTKQQRTAYNLTKLAQHVNPMEHGYAIFEMAEDAGLVMVRLSKYDLDGTYVFITRKEWDEAIDASDYLMSLKDAGHQCGDTDGPMARLCRRYRDRAFEHEF